MKFKIFSLVTAFIGIASFIGFVAEDEKLKLVLENLEKFNNNYPQEKIYLHTDKPYYAIGDEIWFKAYLVNAQTLQPSIHSKIMYIDLIDNKDAIKRTVKIPLSAGFGWGNITLADSLHEGNYRLRAYTNWMRNFEEEFFYDQTFKVGDARSSQVVTQTNYLFDKRPNGEEVTAKINYKNIDGIPYANKEVTYNIELENRPISKGKATTNNEGDITITFINTRPSVQQSGLITTSLQIAENTAVSKFIPIISTSKESEIQFFPEGGELVNGVRSRVGFKAIGADGTGKEVSGYVQDNTGEKVVRLASRHLGMGVFSFMPQAGKTYDAVVQFTDGSEKKVALPLAKPEGVVLNVISTQQDSVGVRVFTNELFSEKNTQKEYFIIAQSSGSVIYTAKAKMTGRGFAIRFPKLRFPTGIAQVTLFDDAMQPLAERLIFINNKDFLNLNIKTDKPSYATRGKVNLSVRALNPDNKPVIGSFSMAVIDESKVPVKPEEEHTILSELLLNSDLRGTVENPNYYFHQIDSDKMEDLDVLLLTQGWRRFKWQNIVANNFPPIVFKEEKTLSISGTVLNNKKPVANGKVTVFTSSGGTFILQAETNADGEFKIDSLIFPDSTKFVVQARTEKDRKFVDITMNETGKQLVTIKSPASDLSVNINSSMMAYLKNSKTQYEEMLKFGLASRNILLNEVRVVETRPVIENSNNLNGAGNADRVLTAKDFENSPTMEFALQGRVAGLIFQNGEAYFTRNMGNPVQIILDGIFVESSFLNTINPQDVESVEILKTIGYTAIYGSRGGGGVIVINTKRGSSGGTSNAYAPGIVTFQPLGYLSSKEFYVPAYDKIETNKEIADFRSTIYWNPAVITDSTGTAKVNFFNADGTGNYRVVLEGMDLQGHIGRSVIQYKVN